MQRRQLILLALCILVPVLFLWQNVMELRAEEPRRAIVSLEMFLTGDWGIPKINGWSYYNKPPFFNWLMAICFALFNSLEEWVVRFPSLFSACLHAYLIYKVSTYYFKRETAILAGFIYITFGEILFFGSITSGEIDLFFSLLTFLQVLSIFYFDKINRPWLLFSVSYGLAAIGFLTKGLPSVAFQALTLLGWLAYNRRIKMLLHPANFAGAGLFLIISGAYFYNYSLYDDVQGFLIRQFKEASMRTGLETPDPIKGAFLFLPRLLLLMLPWSLFLVVLGIKGTKRIAKQSFIRFWILFILVNIPMYMISGEFKARYYYVFLAAFAIITARLIEEADEHNPHLVNKLKYVFTFLAFAVPLACVVAIFLKLPVHLDYKMIRISTFFILSLAAARIFLKSKEWIFALIVVLGIARFGFNIFYLPSWQKDPGIAYYRSSIKQMLQISNGNMIYFHGSPYVFESDASLGPLHFGKTVLTTAPLMNYRIPYYMSRSTGKVMEFHPRLQAGNYYLADKNIADTLEVKALYTLHDNWQQQDYILFYFNPSLSLFNELGNKTNQDPQSELIAKAR
jgi:4-amino-4-deoxy-L-arabinose transferase-like glycosyltransferase